MNLVNEAYKEGGLLQRKLPRYQPRPQQKEFAESIQEAIRENIPFVGEAPTGVGKSLAALIPSSEVIINEDAKVIVVTSSIVLQEQYAQKDIPSLINLIERPITFSSIKGRSNYVCQLKADEKAVSDDIFLRENKEYQEVLAFSQSTKTGDFSELNFVPSAQVYSQFAAMDEHECTGKLCSAYSTCHYYRERKKMLSSQIVVCNYHYFFTAQKSSQMLPEGVKVVVMDEGHEIGDIALNFLEKKYTKFSWRNINTFIQKSGKSLPKYKQEVFERFKTEININEIMFTQESALDSLQYSDVVNDVTKTYFALGVKERKEVSDTFFSHYTLLKHKLDDVSLFLDRHGLPQDDYSSWHDNYSDEEIMWQNALQKLEENISNTIYFLKDFFLFEDEVPLEEDKLIYWIQKDANHGFSLHNKPPTPASFTNLLLNPETTGYVPIIMSATLSTNKSFEYIAEELGVPSIRKEKNVSSPFALDKNLLWYLPDECPAGNEPTHQSFAIQQMRDIIECLNGRTLCLFTSNNALKQATLFLRTHLPRNVVVLSQHETPKRVMIEQLKQNPNTVLLGTRSFFTGVDIQGQNLSAVLIDKIPFPMIGDPVNDYLMNQPNGFKKFTLPSAIVAMKQGIGRLNRTINDKGVITILDGRLSGARYKNIIFGSFDFKIRATRSIDVVRTFIQEEIGECL